MKRTIGFMVSLLSAWQVQSAPYPAGTVINCGSAPDFFKVSIMNFINTRVAPYDDAIITFKEPSALNWNWMQLEKHNEGALSSQHHYNIMGGGKLVISESVGVGVGRGGPNNPWSCGRGSCLRDSINNDISAKLTHVNGVSFVYHCTKK